MGLTVPTPSTGVTGTGDPGPGYATNISNDLNTIDAHDHSSGKGVQVTPAGLNINADLSFGSFNATNLRSARFTSQASALNGGSDVGEIYVKTGDLWYVNSSGVQVQLTSNSTVGTGPAGPAGPQGSPGSFTGTFSLPTATWQPTGGFSGTYKVTSWVSTITLQSGTWTGVPCTYVPTPGYGTAISVVANILGYDGSMQMADVDLKGSFIGASGTTASPGTPTYVGTFTTCYNQQSPVASGWGFALQPSGSSISVVTSAPTGGPSGTVRQLVTLQVTERGNP